MSVVTTGGCASAASLEGSGQRQTQHKGAMPDRVVFLYRLTSGAFPCWQPVSDTGAVRRLLPDPDSARDTLAGMNDAQNCFILCVCMCPCHAMLEEPVLCSCCSS
jgi:hypothetical protein